MPQLASLPERLVNRGGPTLTNKAPRNNEGPGVLGVPGSLAEDVVYASKKIDQLHKQLSHSIHSTVSAIYMLNEFLILVISSKVRSL